MGDRLAVGATLVGGGSVVLSNFSGLERFSSQTDLAAAVGYSLPNSKVYIYSSSAAPLIVGPIRKENGPNGTTEGGFGRDGSAAP